MSPQVADFAAADLGAERLGAVLDHRDAAAAGQLHDLAHSARVAEQVRDHDRLGARAEGGFDRVGGDVVGERIDVGEHGDRRLVEDGREGAHVGDRGGDDLVARLGIDRRDRRVERGRAVRAGVGVLDAHVGGEVLLEPFDELPLGAGERAAFDRGGEREHFVVAQLAAGGVLVGGELDLGESGFEIGGHLVRGEVVIGEW